MKSSQPQQVSRLEEIVIDMRRRYNILITKITLSENKQKNKAVNFSKIMGRESMSGMGFRSAIPYSVNFKFRDNFLFNEETLEENQETRNCRKKSPQIARKEKQVQKIRYR